MLLKTSRKTGGKEVKSQSLVDEYVAKEMSRRQMVQSAMITSVGAWLGATGLAACTTKTIIKEEPAPGSGEQVDTDGDGIPDSPAPDPNNPNDPNKPKHLVGLGYDESDRAAALAAALEQTIGLGMIKAGQSVYLRVNANSGDPYPYSTSPDTLTQVIGMLKDIGVEDIRIGDRSFWGDTGTAQNLVRNGITPAAKKLGIATKVYDDAVDWTTIDSGLHPNWNGAIRLPTDVLEADHHIILSCVKTHFISQVTMSLKIALGLVHATDRSRTGNLKTHDTNVLYKQIAQINKAFTPSLVIQDGYKAVISGGPTVNDRPQGAPATIKGVGDPKIFIVSTDRIAADVMGIAVLKKFSPTYEAVTKSAAFSNPQIKAAIALDLGIKSKDALDVAGPTVENLDDLLAGV